MKLWAALTSSIGKKVVMALSGLLLIGFLCGHLAGNLLIFFGPEALNSYAQHLQDLAPLLWTARLTLLAALGLHLWSASALSIENRRARPKGYRMFRTQKTTAAAQSMLVSGAVVLAYLVYHLLHFTFKSAHPELTDVFDEIGRRDVYGMVVASFQRPWISGIYLGALALLCLHLSHAISSVFQTLGVNHAGTMRAVKFGGSLFAGLLFLGFASIPVACLAGFLPLPWGGAT